jgi:hypothetical protein
MRPAPALTTFQLPFPPSRDFHCDSVCKYLHIDQHSNLVSYVGSELTGQFIGSKEEDSENTDSFHTDGSLKSRNSPHTVYPPPLYVPLKHPRLSSLMFINEGSNTRMMIGTQDSAVHILSFPTSDGGSHLISAFYSFPRSLFSATYYTDSKKDVGSGGFGSEGGSASLSGYIGNNKMIGQLNASSLISSNFSIPPTYNSPSQSSPTSSSFNLSQTSSRYPSRNYTPYSELVFKLHFSQPTGLLTVAGTPLTYRIWFFFFCL